MRDIEQLNYYIKKKLDLIPLRKPTGDSQGKEPLRKEWQTKDYSVDDIKSFFNKGYNIGFRLDRSHLIVDCDPRNYGKENSLDKLMSFLGIDLFTVCTYVKTGSGGYHFYMTLDRDVRLLNELKDRFPGIEFKTHGRQVVCAGCETIHGEYRFGNITSDFTAPDKLIDLLTVRSVSSSSAGSSEDKYISNDELRALLRQLPIKEFQSNDEWLPILQASHHATQGEGLDVFLEWSLSDPKYADDESKIVARWNSLNDDKYNNVTFNTLARKVLDWGGKVNIKTDDFKELADSRDDDIDFSDDGSDDSDDVIFEDIDEEYKVEPLKKKPETKSKSDPSAAIKLVDAITESSSESEVKTALRSALRTSAFMQAKLLSELRERLGLSKRDFNNLIRETKEEIKLETASSLEQTDIARFLAESALKYQFDEGKNLINNANDQLWWFNGLHWQTVTADFVGGMILKEIDRIKKEGNVDLTEFSESNLKNSAFNLIKSLTAQSQDPLDLNGKPQPIVNCQNGELHIDEKKNGEVEIWFDEDHHAESHLLSVTNIVYDPEAKCPEYEKAVHEIFSRLPDCEDVIRHWYEMMGYVLYVNKKPAHFFLLRGNGGDGKTVMVKILAELLGNAVLHESIERFKQGAGSDSHATTSLVGKLLVYDDDVNKDLILPDGVMKKLSEDGKMTANPKGHDVYTFTRVCTVVLCCNGFPKTKDVSVGFRRRAMVIPFNRNFKPEEQDSGIGPRIIKNELSGIFNKALEGLIRLRKRGMFDPPKSCEDAKNRWLNSANSIVAFASECLEKTESESDKVSLPDIYKEYLVYCQQLHILSTVSKGELEDMLESMNYKSYKPRTHSRIYTGLLLKKVEFDDEKDDEKEDEEDQDIEFFE